MSDRPTVFAPPTASRKYLFFGASEKDRPFHAWILGRTPKITCDRGSLQAPMQKFSVSLDVIIRCVRLWPASLKIGRAKIFDLNLEAKR